MSAQTTTEGALSGQDTLEEVVLRCVLLLLRDDLFTWEAACDVARSSLKEGMSVTVFVRDTLWDDVFKAAPWCGRVVVRGVHGLRGRAVEKRGAGRGKQRQMLESLENLGVSLVRYRAKQDDNLLQGEVSSVNPSGYAHQARRAALHLVF